MENNKNTSKKKRKKKKSRRKKRSGASVLAGILVVVLLVAVAAGAGAYLWLQNYADYPYIMPNVYYAGVDLGGMTEQQAINAITRIQEDTSYKIQINFPDRTFYVTPDRDFSAVDIDALVREAMSYGRSETETPLRVYRAVKLAEETSYELQSAVGFAYDQSNVRYQVESIVEQIQTPPEDSTGTGSTETLTVSVTPGQPGRTADVEKVFEDVCQVIESGMAGEVEAEYTDGGIDPKQLEVLVDKLYDSYTAEPRPASFSVDSVTHLVSITKGTPGYDFDKQLLIDTVLTNVKNGNYETVTISMEEVLPNDPNLDLICSQVTSDPTPVEYHNGGLTGGDPGYTLDVEEVAAALETLGYGETVQFELTLVYPEETVEDVQALLFRDTLGKSSTSYVNDANRTVNLRLACAELDGIIMNPGTTFSFNTFVGERTAERGFRVGVVYVDGSSDVETGGGICQVASTVYNAALRAGLEITDRANHQFVVTYVAGGLDATVYWGLQDLCFVNNTGYPIRINASVSGGKVNISIDGTNVTGDYYTIDSKKVSSNSEHITYEAYQYHYNSGGKLVETINLGQSVYDRQ